MQEISTNAPGNAKKPVDDTTWRTMFGTFISEQEIEKSVALFPGEEPEKRYYRATLLVKSCRSERIQSALSLFEQILDQRHTMYERECLYYIAAGYYMLSDMMECKLWVSRLLRLDPYHSQGLALQKTVEESIREERARRIKEIKQKGSNLRKQPTSLFRKFNTSSSFSASSPSSGQVKSNHVITSFNRRIKERRKMMERMDQEALIGEQAIQKEDEPGTSSDRSWQEQQAVIPETFIARFTKEELESLIKSFRSIDKTDGAAFDKIQFSQATGYLGFNNNEFVFRYLFSAFEHMQRRIQTNSDAERSNNKAPKKPEFITLIELDSYLCVMAILLKGSPEERLNLAFDMMTHKSKLEFITEEDFVIIFEFMFDLLAQLGLDVSDHRQAASDIFALLDTKEGGQLSRFDFVQMALKNYGVFAGLGLLQDGDNDDAKGIPENRARGVKTLFGASAWDQATKLMIGMRITQSMLQPLKRGIRPEDFHMELKIQLPTRFSVESATDDGSVISTSTNGTTGNVNNAGNLGDFIDYAPRVFQRLRHLFKISEQDFAKSIGLEHFCGNLMLGNLTSLSLQGSDGRSGSYFFYSHDGRFIVKYIPEKEMLAFKRLLPHYYAYVVAHPHSFITSFVSCFQHDGNDFIVMTNVFNATQKVHEIYDLKGSRVARSNPEGPVYKDNDLTQDIDIGDHKKNLLISVIYEDIKLLQNLKFTDYSILVGVHYLDMTAFNKSQSEKQQLALKRRKKKGKKMDVENVQSDSEEVSDEESSENDNQAGSYGSISSTNENNMMEEHASSRIEDRKGHDGHVIIHQRTDPTPSQVAMSRAHSNSKSRSIESMLFEKGGGVLSRDGRCIYYFGIIDTLTEFDMKKAAERNLKTLKYPTRRNEISAQPPDEYAQRMKEFIINKVC